MFGEWILSASILTSFLGDVRFYARHHAEVALVSYGPLAYIQVQAAQNNKDPEVVIRADRLMARIPKPPAPPLPEDFPPPEDLELVPPE